MCDASNDKRAAIMCKHVADEGYPILRAVFDEPETDEDSGWQFHCGTLDHNSPEDARVWLVSEVIQHDRTLKDVLEYLGSTSAYRTSLESS